MPKLQVIYVSACRTLARLNDNDKNQREKLRGVTIVGHTKWLRVTTACIFTAAFLEELSGQYEGDSNLEPPSG